jgi:DNA-binding response OmpR family regulator
LIDDDVELASLLKELLTREHFTIEMEHDGRRGLDHALRNPPDLVVLDVMLPGMDGFEVLRGLRKSSSVPVLMLTARGEVADRVAGLDRGADDYLVKAFSFVELAARLRALERRRQGRETRLRVGALELDLLQRHAAVAGTRLELTPTEFALLAALIQGGGEPVTRAQLLREVWGYDFDPGTNVVDVHVNRVRRKLEDRGVGDLLRTVRGRGYAAR